MRYILPSINDVTNKMIGIDRMSQIIKIRFNIKLMTFMLLHIPIKRSVYQKLRRAFFCDITKVIKVHHIIYTFIHTFLKVYIQVNYPLKDIPLF